MTTRSRSRSSNYSEGTYRHQFKPNGGSWTDVATANQVLSFDTQTMVDEVVDWQALKAAGQVVENPCVLERSVRTSGGGTYFATGPVPTWGQYRSAGDGSQSMFHGTTFGASPWSDWPWDDALTASEAVKRAKLVALAQMDNSPFAFAEDAAEIRETLRFMRDPLGTINRILNKIRRRENPIRDFASLWLEYRFALRPLIKSVLDLAEALNGERTRPRFQTARGFVGPITEARQTTINRVANPSENFDFSLAQSMRVDVHAGIHYEVTNPLWNWQFQLGFRVGDIPETAWAILPYSFMVDRFLDISSAISAVRNLANPDLRIRGAFERVKIDLEGFLTLLAQNSSNGWSVAIQGDQWYEKSFKYQRLPWSPTLRDAVPTIQLEGLVKEASYVVDLIALIIGRVPSSGRGGPRSLSGSTNS